MAHAKLESLQVLRGVAVLLVVNSHAVDLAQWGGGEPHQARIGHLGNAGAFGADLFLVISGVIIGLSASRCRDRADAHVFLLRRFLRIAPLYWLVTALALAYFAAVNRTIGHGDVLASLLLMPAMAGNQRLPVIEVGWTLGFEALFYLVTYVVLVSRTLPAVTVAWMTCLAVAGLGVLGLPGAFAGWLLNPIMMEFAAGIAIAVILSCRGIPWHQLGAACLAAGSALFLLTAWLGYAQVDDALSIVDGSLSAQRALLWGGPAALLVAGALFLERAGRFLAGRLLVWIGNASFSLYLTHWLLFRVLRSPVAALGIPPDSVVLLGMALAVAIGFGFYAAVERPFMRLAAYATSRQPPASVPGTPARAPS